MRFALAATAACGLALLLLPSCAKQRQGPTTRPATAQKSSDRALKDPFGYKPDWSGTGVSGGGTHELDQEGLRRDIDNVFIR